MKKIILFGAGQIGYSALMFFGSDAIHCFVDNNLSRVGKAFCGKKIISFQDLLELYNEKEYELIISCLAFAPISAQLTKAGITSFKKFERPLIYDYVTSVKKCMPKELLSSNRLDVIVKYLYAKDILSAIKDTPAKSLYARTILTTQGGTELTREKTKEGMDDFFASFEQLCQSMQQEAFKENHFIAVAKNNVISDGAHRVAVALALNKEVYVGEAGEQAFCDYGFAWFVKNGFSFEDKARILKGFADLYDDCGIFVLYAPMRERWDYIEAQIEQEYKVVGSIDIDFSHNFIAFEILIKEIYGDYSEDGGIADKVSLLKMAPLITRVMLVSNEKNKLERDDFYQSMTDFKFRIRDILDYEMDKESFCLFHASSCYNEFIHLKNILLSVNNLKSIEGRISSVYRREFLRRVLFVRDYCKENDIPIEQVCVLGTSTMEVLGIKKAGDLDFVIASGLHSRIFSDVPAKDLENLNLPKKILDTDEVTGEAIISLYPYTQTLFPSGDKAMENDVFISNDSYHIWFYGLKFLNLEFQISKKECRGMDKDKIDLRTIELYYDFIRNFDDKKVLREQLKAELIRREESKLKREAMMRIE